MHTTIQFSEINWLAILVVLVLSFVLGALWHSRLLFGKAWTEDAKPLFDASVKGSVAKLFGLSAVYHFIGITALAIFIGQDTTPVGGLLRGLVIGLFWVLTSIGVTYLFAGRSFRLFMIDAGFYIFFYSLAGFILGVW